MPKCLRCGAGAEWLQGSVPKGGPSNISTHFEMLMDADEQARIGATPDKDDGMRVMRLLSAYNEVLGALLRATGSLGLIIKGAKPAAPGHLENYKRACKAIGD